MLTEEQIIHETLACVYVYIAGGKHYKIVCAAAVCYSDCHYSAVDEIQPLEFRKRPVTNQLKQSYYKERDQLQTHTINLTIKRNKL